MSKLRAFLRTGGFIGWSAGNLAAYEAHRLLLSDEARSALLARYRDRFTHGVLRLFGVELLMRGSLDLDRGALVVANHQSALDIGVMLSLSRGVLVSRHDVADWPLLGRMAKHGSTIFVDRDDRRSGASALREVRRRVKEGRVVVAFPEGGTFPGDSVHEFHPGTFAAVRSLGAPVIPVGLAYSPAVHYGKESFAEHMSNVAAREKTRIAVHVGDPLPDASDARAAAVAARAEVERLVHRGRTELRATER
ncbi:MAG: lysophospholipid acyltransferase family protein [Polyangiales bacterium]